MQILARYFTKMAGSLFGQTELCVLGIALSLYAFYVEWKKHADKNYVAFCDFSENMSCSRVLTSKYSKGFGLVEILLGNEHFLNIPNCIVGILFYTLQLGLSLLDWPWCHNVLLYTSLVGCLGSVYLAVILFCVLKDFCVVCIATYLVNFGLLYQSVYT